ncbi:hypothetical protein KN63_00755 [Smithella sp. F21]|nr:hypothetical protein KN63_00755 [Smithella sp. F21]
MATDKHKDNRTDEIKQKVKARVAQEAEIINAEKKRLTQTEDKKADYSTDGGYLKRTKFSKDGAIQILLANFVPSIMEKIVVDDGSEERKRNPVLVIAGKLSDGTDLPRLEVQADKFLNMNWVAPWLPAANMSPGSTTKDHIRFFMQKNSHGHKVKTIFAQTGWKFIKGKPYFLHGAGAVGAEPGMDISVKLDTEIQRYSLPLPPPLDKQEEAADFLELERRGLETSLTFLDIGKREITYPLFSSIWLAPMISILDCPVNFSYYVQGPARSYKTSVLLLVLSFFGQFNKAQKLANFTNTEVAIELAAFRAADVPFVLDDLSPSTSKRIAEQKEKLMQTIVRSFANRSSRARGNPDITLRESMPPRGLLYISAELLPTVESIITRLVTVEFTRETIDLNKLSRLQADAPLLPFAMHAYLSWMRENMVDIQNSFREQFVPLRQQSIDNGCDPRIAEHTAFQIFALQTALTFFQHRGVLDDGATERIILEAWDVFICLAKRQEAHVDDDDPVELFFDILVTLLIQGQARLEPHPHHTGDRIGNGEQLGWFDSHALYLLPAAAWGMVQNYYKKANAHFPITSYSTFFSIMKTRHIIQLGTDGKTTIKANMAGKRNLRILKVIDSDYVEKCLSIT